MKIKWNWRIPSDRMASRILGMGDVLTLIEQTTRTFDAEEEKLKEIQKNKDLI